MDRRTFLQANGAAAAYFFLSQMGFSQSPSGELVPSDKRLSEAWIKALTDRGTPEIYWGDELKYVGMPIGGICSGLVYLGGDGSLWLWDVFNRDTMEKKVTYGGKTFGNRDGALYVEPMEPRSPFEQGFALRYKIGETADTRALNKTGWSDISFEGSYPVGTVTYGDKSVPVSVQLQAFSPFVPLSFDDSSLPATILNYNVTNNAKEIVNIQLAGWMENIVLGTGTPEGFTRANQLIQGNQYKGVLLASSGESGSLLAAGNFGTMAIIALDPNASADAQVGTEQVGMPGEVASKIKADSPNPMAMVSSSFDLAPGSSKVISFVVAWHFPNIDPKIQKNEIHSYATKFKNASEVVDYIASNFDRLQGDTLAWHKTWNDSTLPYWFLKRTFTNTCNLATTTSYRFSSGQFWSWEGIYACEGTCTHVWYYAQAMARIFPEMERALRTKTDYAFAQNPKTGVVNIRGTHGGYATDGQAGIILRTYREHLMTEDNSFLTPLWPKVRLAMERLISQANEKGLLTGPQPNTLDTAWYGEIAWLSGVYLAALRAAEEMAKIVGDTDFVQKAQQLFKTGAESLVPELFNGEYFINKVDPAHLDKINSGSGCEIDQLMGQSWAWQVGLGRIFPEAETLVALKSLYRYNFAPDAGHYHEVMKLGRWYAMPGEAGLLVCTFPKPDWNFQKAAGKGPGFAIQYFNECQSGYEHEVASNMIGEGMVQEGLTVLRAIHDRYSPSKRNPYNEVECGDHYSRAMASYSSFITMCGFEYDGPKGLMGFSPRLNPEKFKAAFTSAAGWGSYEQEATDSTFTAQISLVWGHLSLARLDLKPILGFRPTSVQVSSEVQNVPARLVTEGERVGVQFGEKIIVKRGQTLIVKLTLG